MIKIKFLHLSSAVRWGDLRNSLMKLRYSDVENQGINVSSANDSEIRATFYEKITYTEVINHPVNGITESIGTTYFATEFIIFKKFRKICILNSSKRINVLLTYLATHVKSLGASELMIDTARLTDFLKETIDCFRVKRISYPPFELSTTSKVYFSISSISDAYDELGAVNLPLPVKPMKISFVGQLVGKKISGEAHASGVLYLSEVNYESILESILAEKDLLTTESCN